MLCVRSVREEDDTERPEPRDSLMDVKYLEPLQSAWDRMVRILFRPFDLNKWLVVGFAAWLATLTDGGVSFPTGIGDWSSVTQAGQEASQEMGELSGCVLAAIVAIVILVLALVVAVLWVEARGEFVFLDDVVQDRTAIAAPWRSFAPQGNSLFLWRLGFVFAVLVSMAVIWAPFVSVAARTGDADPGSLFVMLLIAAILATLVVVLAAAVVAFLLEGFVVPLMYRDRLRTSEAWRRLLPLVTANAGPFLVCGLVVVGLHLVLGAAVLVLVVATCCIALIPLVVPYVGTVVLLPVPVVFRLYTLEFLGQFGPEWRVLPEPVPVAPPAAPPILPPSPPVS